MAKQIEELEEGEFEDAEAEEKFPEDEDEESTDGYDEEDAEEVAKVIEKTEKRGRPKKAVQTQPKEKEKESVTSYGVYHQPERTGIANVQTKEPVAETMWDALALILTKLEKIEEALY